MVFALMKATLIYTDKAIQRAIKARVIYLSGPSNSYQQGPLGVIEVGAYADMLLVDGNPLENIDLVADADKNFVVIMKDGKIYKNTLH